MKKFTYLPRKLRLDTGPIVASCLVLAQMPSILVGHQVGSNLRSVVVPLQHLSLRALFRYEVRREPELMRLILHSLCQDRVHFLLLVASSQVRCIKMWFLPIVT